MRIFVYVLGACILGIQGPTAAWAEAPGRDPFHDSKPQGRVPGVEGNVRERSSADENCVIDAGEVAQSANGEQFHYGTVVTLLSSPSCMAVSRSVGLAAITYGINFSSKAPFKLDGFAAAFAKNDLESARYMDQNLAQSIPGLLRTNPLSGSEMLPLVAQLAILSPDAARSALSAVVFQEVYAGERRLSGDNVRGGELVAAELAKTIVKLGGAEGPIATRIAANVSEMAMLAQEDSLVRFFRGISEAAALEPALVPTVNISAGAFNRGVLKSQKIYTEENRRSMLRALFLAVQAMLKKGEVLEAGAAELNQAMAALMSGEKLTETGLRSLWRAAVKVLAQSKTQDAIADAFAASLTPRIVFLKPSDLDPIMAAARNYPQMAGSVQANFLDAWNREWKALQDNRISPEVFNRNREKYFEPMVAEIMNFEPAWIDPYFLREALAKNLVEDEMVEKKFPRMVLTFLDRRDRASRAAAVEPGPEPVVASLAESLAVVWSLNRVHMPALSNWVKKYER